jgi:hypothetical protein
MSAYPFLLYGLKFKDENYLLTSSSLPVNKETSPERLSATKKASDRVNK